jgi:hypothetical protein
MMANTSLDTLRVAWQLIYGVECYKLFTSAKKGRATRVFLHPDDFSKLCWVSKRKSPQNSFVQLQNAKISTISAPEAAEKAGFRYFIEVQTNTRKLNLGFTSQSLRDKIQFSLQHLSTESLCTR